MSGIVIGEVKAELSSSGELDWEITTCSDKALPAERMEMGRLCSTDELKKANTALNDGVKKKKKSNNT